MKKYSFLTICICAAIFSFKAFGQSGITLPLLPGEKWWAGTAQYGYKMPFDGSSIFSFNLYGDASNNQSSPLLLSSKGRWVWCNDPIQYSFKNDTLRINAYSYVPIQNGTAGADLRSAYLYASSHFFPPSGKWPDSLLITSPQYNLWIELQYNPNQKDVLDYAKKVMDNGMPAGVLMIDDNWTNYYGEFDFDRAKFPDPKSMIRRLHEQGFKVMVWISPFITPDSKEFRELLSKKYLLMDNGGNREMTFEKSHKPLLVHWWNGYSACLDLSNPGAKEWLLSKLHYLQQTYGIGGFKLDAGDPYFYDDPHLLSFKNITPNDHCEEWAKIGLEFPLNEYRAMWKMGGQPLVQRLSDKSHSWTDLQKLIPNTIVQQLMGYTFTCPDMIGGGEFTSFLPGMIINQKLIVRSAQVHALMPMMQFSVAPWRILDSVHLRAVLDAVKLRRQMLPEIMHVLRNAALTGEPAIRTLAYDFPNENFENITDEFMLGQNILVAPVITETDTRTVILPKGNWLYKNKKWQGGKEYRITAALNEVPFFVRTK